jgi:prohibitin 1
MTVILLGVLIVVALLILRQNFPKYFPKMRWLLLIPLALVLLVGVSMVRVVPPGQVGVLILFGKVYRSIPEGMNLVNPLASMELMSVRTKELMEHAEAPSREGLNVVIEVSVLYHLVAQDAAKLYSQIGPTYEEVVVKPQFRAAIRGITVRHEAKDLYTSSREMISDEIFKELAEDLKTRGIMVEKILLRRIQLPKAVEEAINAKLAADQDAQRMRFVLDKERQEAERKRIEAKGIQDFQTLVSQGLSEQLLKWRGIEATKALAESHNAKVVIVGGKDGLPLILNSGGPAEK